MLVLIVIQNKTKMIHFDLNLSNMFLDLTFLDILFLSSEEGDKEAQD